MADGEHTHAGERHENDALAEEIGWARALGGNDQPRDRDNGQHGHPAERAVLQPVLPPEPPVPAEQEQAVDQDAGNEDAEQEGSE